MADIHLEIKGIEGDSVATGYEGQIDCNSWSWGASSPASMHTATGGSAGGTMIQDITISKLMDKSSPNLMLKCSSGEHLTEAILTCVKSGGERVKWLRITMKGIIISNVSSSGSEGSAGMESVSLNFAEYKMEYWPQESGGAEGASIDTSYQIAEHRVI
jgi:type VI secretion system secreted protein Hcp